MTRIQRTGNHLFFLLEVTAIPPNCGAAVAVCPLGKEYPVADVMESPAGTIRGSRIHGRYTRCQLDELVDGKCEAHGCDRIQAALLIYHPVDEQYSQDQIPRRKR